MGHENWPAMFSLVEESDERNEYCFNALLYIDLNSLSDFKSGTAVLLLDL